MTFLPLKYAEIEKPVQRIPENRKIVKRIEAFMESNFEAAEIRTEHGEYSSIAVAVGRITRALKSCRVGCTILVKNSRIFIFKNYVKETKQQ